MARNTEGGVRVPGVGGSGRDARLRAEDDLDVVGLRLQSRGSSRDSLWAHSLGDRRRRAPVVLSTLPPALVARLLIAPARVGSASAAHPCSGRQALQLGRAARAAVGSAQPHVLFLGRLARLAVELRRESSTTLRPGRARWCRDERRRGDGHGWSDPEVFRAKSG